MTPAQCFSLVELAKDTNGIGKTLRCYDGEILRAGDKWAEQSLEHQKKHQNPKRPPFADSWQYLLDAPAASDNHKAVFRAAQSQLKALRRLASIARGEANLHNDWLEEMEEAHTNGNKVRFLHAAEKVAAARAKYELFHNLKQAPGVDRKFREWRQQQIEKSKVERRKRGDGIGVRPLPCAREFRNNFRQPCMLVDWWVKGPSGTAGLMFYGNKALTKLLSKLTGLELKRDNVKKLRRALGLISVSGQTESPVVWDINVHRRDGTEWKIEGRQRNGKLAFAFWGPINFNHQPILPPESLPVTQF